MKHWWAHAFFDVEECQLGAGVGTFPPGDQAYIVAPATEVDQLGEFGREGAVTVLAVEFSGGDLVLFLGQ
jgi:hypothetical protein